MPVLLWDASGLAKRGIELMRRHNINSSDAAILAAFLEYAGAEEETCILVSSDLRLNRSAIQEGLRVLNPERTTPTELSAALA